MLSQNQPMRERLIISLDVPDTKTARDLVKSIGDAGVFYKIGYQLILADGLDLVKELIGNGKKVFLDIKLLDIDNTIAQATENAIRLGVSMLSLHAYPKVMRAAQAVAAGSPLCLLGVTVLTSMDTADLQEAGYEYKAESLVLERAKQAKQIGLGGLVASAAEAKALRQIVGSEMALVTPGIRMRGDDKGDQKRVMTPREAVAAGASHLVVGRPIVKATNPKAALLAVLEDMEKA